MWKVPEPVLSRCFAMLPLKTLLQTQVVSRKGEMCVRSLALACSVLDITRINFERIEPSRFDELCDYMTPRVISVVAVKCMRRTDYCGEQFSKLCCRFPVGLQSLNLSANLLDEDGISNLSAVLSDLQSLRTLNLSGCFRHASDGSKQRLLMSLPVSIKTLNLDGFYNAGLLAVGLRRLVHLTALSLMWCTTFDEEADGGTGLSPAFGAREIDAICAALPAGLKELRLGGSVDFSYYGCEVAESLARQLEKFPGLIGLGLQRCPMDDVSPRSFGRLLDALPTGLKYLALVEPEDDASSEFMWDSILRLTALEALFLGTPYGSEQPVKFDSRDLAEMRQEFLPCGV
eukprot:TRINITY_DN51141_c0_g1_i1.p1 TRINITY_DN51141_c0_g1~~TRINITY_DN51141_c0_g1_i1.p1  ORF type:complete len:345 (+),score=38.81 TRINITY_DN51141_c0_g1_i1:66-1100(+)